MFVLFMLPFKKIFIENIVIKGLEGKGDTQNI